jgi:hypothetical protein
MQCSSSVAGRILRDFGPSPISVMVDLAAPDTWAFCGAVLKAFPKLEEIGFIHSRTGDHHSGIDLKVLSSHLCVSGFKGSRLVLKNVWLRCRDLILLEQLQEGWENVTTLSVLRSGLAPEEGEFPSRFFGSVFPRLGKLIVCGGKEESAPVDSNGLYRLLELVVATSSISQFEISSIGPAQHSEEQTQASRKSKWDFLYLFGMNAHDTFTSLVDEDGLATDDSVEEFFNAYRFERYFISFWPFSRMRFFSFRLEERQLERHFGIPSEERFGNFLWSVLAFCGENLECILVETMYRAEPGRELRVSTILQFDLEGLQAHSILFPGSNLPNVKVIVGNAKDGYEFYDLKLSWPLPRLVRSGRLSASQCKDKVQTYVQVQSPPVDNIRRSERLRRKNKIRVGPGLKEQRHVVLDI